MKRHHFIAFLCTILIPPGVLLGDAVGARLGSPLTGIAVGAAAGCLLAFLVPPPERFRRSPGDEV